MREMNLQKLENLMRKVEIMGRKIKRIKNSKLKIKNKMRFMNKISKQIRFNKMDKSRN